MKSLRPRVIVVNSTAGAADFTTANQMLLWLGLPLARYMDVHGDPTGETFVRAAVAETPKVMTITITGSPTNGTNYQFTVTQTTPRNRLVAGQLRQKRTWSFSITAPSTGVITVTTVAAQIVLALNALVDFGAVAANVAGVVTVTGDANAGDFSIHADVQGTSAAVAVGTAYVASVGDYYYALNFVGAASADLGATTDVYTHIRIFSGKLGVPHLTIETKQNEQVDILVNETQDATDTAAFILRVTRALQGLNAAGSVIDQEEFAVI